MVTPSHCKPRMSVQAPRGARSAIAWGVLGIVWILLPIQLPGALAVEEKPDIERLQGEWILVSIETQAERIAMDKISMKVKNDTIVEIGCGQPYYRKRFSAKAIVNERGTA